MPGARTRRQLIPVQTAETAQRCDQFCLGQDLGLEDPSVREWPFDLSMLTRIALYLFIPLGSWLGGAFVERLLAAWLD